MKISEFRQLPDNPRYSIWLEPLWAIPGTIVLFYAPLYMKGAGLSDIEIGIINSVNLYFAFIFQLLAGTVTNKMGRKRTTLIFDLLSWSVPMFVWAFSQSFWMFLIAYLLNATSKFVTVSFNCLIIEDAQEHQRPLVFGIMNMIITAAGVLTPIAGTVIASYGIMPTLKVVYIIGGISMTVLFFLRNRLTHETEAGKALMEAHSRTLIWSGLKNSLRLFGQSFRSRRLFPILVITIVSNIILQLNFFQVIYLQEQLGFGNWPISLIPFITALTIIILYTVLIPRMRQRSEEGYVTASIVLCAAGSLLFLFIPAGNMPVLFTVIVILAAGTFILQTYRDALLMNRLGSHDKADMFSAVQTVMSLIAIPWGYFAGLLYNYKPSLLFALISALYALLLAAAFYLSPASAKSAAGQLKMEEEPLNR